MYLHSMNLPSIQKKKKKVSEHRGNPGTGNSKGLVWRFECLMFGYFLPVTCTVLADLTTRRNLQQPTDHYLLNPMTSHTVTTKQRSF